jgi:hypothetical protein
MADPTSIAPNDRLTTPVNDRTTDMDLEKGSPGGAESDFDVAPTIVESDRASSRAMDEKAVPDDDDNESRDPDVVAWDGPNDPENPMNWTDRKKWANIAVLSIMTLVT